MPRLLHAVLALAVLPAMLVVGSASPGAAHEERPASFPSGEGVPRFLGYDNPRRRVVCTPASARAVQEMPVGALKRRNRALLRECEFRSSQDAVDSVRRRRTSVYVLPGRYTEREWAEAPQRVLLPPRHRVRRPARREPVHRLDHRPGGAGGRRVGRGRERPDRPLLRRPAAVPAQPEPDRRHGRPHDDDNSCDSRFCGLQLVGTGRRPRDVTVDNRFSKPNALRADRAGGFYLRGMAFQQAEFNAIYLLETDGFVVDRVMAAPTTSTASSPSPATTGSSGGPTRTPTATPASAPGSASDLNADNPSREVSRYAIEIRRNRSHHNTLGYSGTAGNSVWAHHNDFDANATGIATDSLFPDHPCLPQDHARWNDNTIRSNNENWYARFVDAGVCERPMAERGYLEGTVCPVVPTPVGTGVLIAGGNANSTDHKWIYDNWRYGTMQFWVPPQLRDEYDPTTLYDTSNHNATYANRMGIAPDGSVAHNGLDHWWDDQGDGNCWEGNAYSRGERTDNFLLPVAGCDEGGSVFTPGAPVKDAGFLSCSQDECSTSGTPRAGRCATRSRCATRGRCR